MFVAMYHPDIPSTTIKPVEVALQSVDDHAARGWLLVDPDEELPTPATPYYTTAAADSRFVQDAQLGTKTADLVTAGTGALPVALRAASGSRLDQKVWPVGRKVGWCGDSITNGSSSTNASTDSFRALVPGILGTARVRTFTETINGGVAGERSDQLLVRMDGIIAQGPELLFVMIGTNDAGADVPVATYATNIRAIVAKAQTAGIPVVVGTVPPQASARTAAIHARLRSYNLWLRLWAPTVGVPLAATHAALVDKTTGYLAAAYDSSDGVHPNNAGHLALASAIATALSPLIRDYPWLPASGPLPGFSLIANPLFPNNAGWTIIAGSATTTFVPPTAGDGLPAGQWMNMNIDNTAGGSSLNFSRGHDLSAGWSVGDKLLVCFYGKWVAGSQSLKVQILDQSNAVRSVLLDGIKAPAGVGTPFMSVFTVPAGVTTLKLGLNITVAAGVNGTLQFGAADVYNLTTAGLAALPYAA